MNRRREYIIQDCNSQDEKTYTSTACLYEIKKRWAAAAVHKSNINVSFSSPPLPKKQGDSRGEFFSGVRSGGFFAPRASCSSVEEGLPDLPSGHV